MYRPDDFNKFLLAEIVKIPDPELIKGDIPQALFFFANAGADAMLRALEPIIRDKAPSSSLIDLIYGGNDEYMA